MNSNHKPCGSLRLAIESRPCLVKLPYWRVVKESNPRRFRRSGFQDQSLTTEHHHPYWQPLLDSHQHRKDSESRILLLEQEATLAACTGIAPVSVGSKPTAVARLLTRIIFSARIKAANHFIGRSGELRYLALLVKSQLLCPLELPSY